MKGREGRMSRRGFLATAVSGLVTAGVVGAAPVGAVRVQEEKTDVKKKGKVLTRKLGKTDIEVPIVSMGVMNADNPGVVKASYELGVRHFDTAAYYQGGRNESMVGSVIGELGVRDKTIIGTKIFTRDMREGLDDAGTRSKIISECEKSLGRLKMDYVDILYVHVVDTGEFVRNEAVAGAMQHLKEQGKARYIGVSTHRNMHEVINAVIKTKVYDVVLTAINFTMTDYSELLDAIREASKKGIGIVAMKTQAGSHRSWNREIGPEHTTSTIATASLKWALQNEYITTAIPGYTTYEHMEEDFSVAYDLQYTEAEKRFFSEVDLEVGIGFCRQCDYCLATCPKGVDIPTLMRTHLYAVQYGNFDHARRTIDGIPRSSGIDACKSCTSCKATCRHAVDVSGRIDELKLIYA